MKNTVEYVSDYVAALHAVSDAELLALMEVNKSTLTVLDAQVRGVIYMQALILEEKTRRVAREEEARTAALVSAVASASLN